MQARSGTASSTIIHVPAHFEIQKYYPSNNKAHDPVLQNLMMRCFHAELMHRGKCQGLSEATICMTRPVLPLTLAPVHMSSRRSLHVAAEQCPAQASNPAGPCAWYVISAERSILQTLTGRI